MDPTAPDPQPPQLQAPPPAPHQPQQLQAPPTAPHQQPPPPPQLQAPPPAPHQPQQLQGPPPAPHYYPHYYSHYYPHHPQQIQPHPPHPQSPYAAGPPPPQPPHPQQTGPPMYWPHPPPHHQQQPQPHPIQYHPNHNPQPHPMTQNPYTQYPHYYSHHPQQMQPHPAHPQSPYAPGPPAPPPTSYPQQPGSAMYWPHPQPHPHPHQQPHPHAHPQPHPHSHPQAPQPHPHQPHWVHGPHPPQPPPQQIPHAPQPAYYPTPPTQHQSGSQTPTRPPQYPPQSPTPIRSLTPQHTPTNQTPPRPTQYPTPSQTPTWPPPPPQHPQAQPHPPPQAPQHPQAQHPPLPHPPQQHPPVQHPPPQHPPIQHPPPQHPPVQHQPPQLPQPPLPPPPQQQPQQQQPQLQPPPLHPPQSSTPKKEITFPKNCVEATKPITNKKRRLTSKDVTDIEVWRLLMCLRSGLLAESSWAIDVLSILLNDDSTFMYFNLHNMPGLLDSVLEHFKKCLKELFKGIFKDADCPNFIDWIQVYFEDDNFIESSRRCTSLSTIIRDLSFIPGNDAEMSKHSGLLLVLGRLLLLKHDEIVQNEQDKSPSEWYLLSSLREDSLVVISNISSSLDLSPYNDNLNLSLLDGLLHWACCTSSYALDPFPAPSVTVSPQRLALESLAKLSILEGNVDLILATPPWSRIEKLFEVLIGLLNINEDQTIREFSLVLLSNLTAADSGIARKVALTGSAIPRLLSFLETSEAQATTQDMLRRAATTLKFLSQIVDNHPLFSQHQQRLLNLVMSQKLDQEVVPIIADVIFEISLSD